MCTHSTTGFREMVMSITSTGHILKDEHLAISLSMERKNKDDCTETLFQLYMHAWLYHMYIISVYI